MVQFGQTIRVEEKKLPLSGFLKTSDPGRISTISITGDKTRKKKLVPTKYDSNHAQQTMYVRDCIEHDLSGELRGVVPVQLFRFKEGQGWQEVGIAKCCTLCWKIIVPPTDDFPRALPLPVGKAREQDETRATLKTNRKTAKKVASKRNREESERVKRLLDLISQGEDWDVYELADHFKVSRQTMLKSLKMLEDTGTIVADRKGPGKGNKTYWRSA